MIRWPRLAVAALLVAAPLAASAATPHLPANIAAAAADPGRRLQVSDDAARHGPEILAFAGVKRGAKVIDLIPGAAYWTRLFAKAVGPSGHVYGIWPEPYAREAGKNVADYKALATTYPNVSLAVEPVTELSAPEKVDLVFTSQNYHDYADKFMGAVGPAVLNKAVFAALKPGGVFLIIDHVAPAGTGMADTDTLHRIDPAIVKTQLAAAGFLFVGSNPLLANAADDHSKAVFDRSIRGRTDQFIYKFRKPG